MVSKTFASTNSRLFALLCRCGLQKSKNLRLEFCNSDESLDHKRSTLDRFLVTNQALVLAKHQSNTTERLWEVSDYSKATSMLLT
jgi:hypothetical protein